MRNYKEGSSALPYSDPVGTELMDMEDRTIWAAVAKDEEEDATRDAILALAERIGGATDPPEALVAVARALPSLDSAAGLDPWSPDAFEAWMLSDECTVSGYWSALLVLNLWERKPESFDPRVTELGWDATDRQALDRLVDTLPR